VNAPDDVYPKGALEIASLVRSGELSATEVMECCFERILAYEDELHAFNTLVKDAAMENAERVDGLVADGVDPGVLAGVPIALKDNMCTRGIPTTCSSRILQGWLPPYDATVVRRVRDAGAIVVGKTNLDEFAMGSSTENSAFGPTKNPWDPSRVPGGSSGGSAAAVASGFTPLALGSDTGGSIRQPAALCGIVGIKPTYGLVSRFGLVAFASSLDQIGPFANTVADAAACLQTIAGHDKADSTSIDQALPRYAEALGQGVDGLRVGVIEDFLFDANAGCVDAVRRSAEALASLGADVDTVAIPELMSGLDAYYLIAPAEASSNLARYDGVRYGLRVDASDVSLMNTATRTAGFGQEVKRRIMLGTYALSAGYYDAYYGQAQRIRTLVVRAFAGAYERFDVLIGPTTPSYAFPIGAKTADPLEMYLSDLFTIPSNLAGHPAMNVPFALSDEGLPIGVQVLANALGEFEMLRVGAALESMASPSARGPIAPRTASGARK
jgi:aspartyl-tRNA(Asn)/glutamyl-tRNA(Gln) amidotransferase subunit A